MYDQVMLSLMTRPSASPYCTDPGHVADVWLPVLDDTWLPVLPVRHVADVDVDDTWQTTSREEDVAPCQYGEPKASRSSPCPTVSSLPYSSTSRAVAIPSPPAPSPLSTNGALNRATRAWLPPALSAYLARLWADRRSETRERELAPRARRSANQNARRFKARGVRPQTAPRERERASGSTNPGGGSQVPQICAHKPPFCAHGLGSALIRGR